MSSRKRAKRRARREEGEAYYRLGLACFRGPDADAAEARRLHHLAAELGVADAQFELSLLLAQGLGGPVDARGARLWEDRAALAGQPRACLNVAVRFARATPPDLERAVQWYERAAHAGNAEAAARLCKMRLSGQGVTADEAAAKRWFAVAVSLGYDFAAAG